MAGRTSENIYDEILDGDVDHPAASRPGEYMYINKPKPDSRVHAQALEGRDEAGYINQEVPDVREQSQTGGGENVLHTSI